MNDNLIKELQEIAGQSLNSAAHDPKNVLLVWWYNPTSGQFVANKDPKWVHSNDYDAVEGVVSTELLKWVRGRVFNCNSFNYIILYWPENHKLTMTSSKWLDLWDKCQNTVGHDKLITRFIDENGDDIVGLFEKVVKK